MSTSKLFGLLLITLACVGCSSPPKQQLIYTYITTKTVPTGKIDTNAQVQLAETAVSTDHALQELSAIQMAEHPGVSLASPYNAAAIGMDQVATVDWNGPVEPFLQKIARLTDYQLKILGRAPAIPVMLNLHMTDSSVADVLRNIEYQVIKQAHLKIYPDMKVIELRYE